MTFAEYLQEVARYFNEHRAPSRGNIRLGQAYVNCLPAGMFDEIATTEIDPFYNDNNIPDFLCYIETVWEV